MSNQNGCGSGTITIVDEWEIQGDAYRLIDNGFGPKELQVTCDVDDPDWQPERGCYVHGVLCSRIIELSEKYKYQHVALTDALSAFNNEEGKTTIVNEERLEAWERALDL